LPDCPSCCTAQAAAKDKAKKQIKEINEARTSRDLVTEIVS